MYVEAINKPTLAEPERNKLTDYKEKTFSQGFEPLTHFVR